MEELTVLEELQAKLWNEYGMYVERDDTYDRRFHDFLIDKAFISGVKFIISIYDAGGIDAYKLKMKKWCHGWLG